MTVDYHLEDEIEIGPHASPSGQDEPKLLIFHITGNPGLIEYYRTFLTLLFDQLRDLSLPASTPSLIASTPSSASSSPTTSRRKIATHIHGTSLAGFSVDSGIQHDPNAPYDLEHQIRHIERALAVACARSGASRVVLMGHSVGSYVLLEVLRRRKEHLRTPGDGGDGGVKVIGGICLFPTVTHIAKSPSGRKFTVRWNSFFISCYSFSWCTSADR